MDRLATGADLLLKEASRLLSDEAIERLGKLEEVLRRGAERRDLEERTKRENRRSNFTLVRDAVFLAVSVVLIGVGLTVTPDHIPFAAIASGLVGGAAGFGVGHRRREADDTKERDEAE